MFNGFHISKISFEINIFSNKKIRDFLIVAFPEYELNFLSFNEVDHKPHSIEANIIILNYIVTQLLLS